MELNFHGGSYKEVVTCMKNNLNPVIFKEVYEDNNPGFVRRHLKFIEKIKKKLEWDKFTWLRWILTKVSKILSVYMDLLKDTALTTSIFITMGGLTSLISFPTKMTSVVVFSLTAFIFIPLVLSSIQLAISRIQESQEDLNFFQKVWIFVKSILLFAFHPLLITNEIENLKEETRFFMDEDEQIIEMLGKISYLEKLLATFLRSELQLESVNQMTGTFLLLFMSLTTSPTTGGMETMFQKTDIRLLVLSILWSLKTAATEMLKFMSLEKYNFPAISKCFVLLYGLLAATTKTVVNVVFFAPSLGLFNILNHWKAEQIPFQVRSKKFQKINSVFSNEDMMYLFNATPTPWASIDRWTYEENPKPPNYTLYTGLTLGNYFQLFLLTTVVQVVIIMFTKRCTSPSFKSACLPIQAIHALECSTISIPFQDWDTKSGTIEEHEKRRNEVSKEVLATLGVNKIIGSAMLVPLIFTGMQIVALLKWND